MKTQLDQLKQENKALRKRVEELSAKLSLIDGRLAECLADERRTGGDLQESEERYRLIFEMSRDAMMTLAPPSWAFTSGNPAICEVFGVADVEAFIRLKPWQVSPEFQPDGRPSLEKAMEMIGLAMRDGANFFEWTHRRVNGECFPATVLLTRIENAGEVFLHATVKDISAQKHSEEKLRIGEEFRNRVFESSRMPIVVMDAKTYEYLDCNPAAVEIYRFPAKEELLGKTPLDMSAPVQYDGTPSERKALQFIGQAIAQGSAVFEWRHQRPDGEIWDAEVHLLCFQMGDRRLLQFSLVDITARKRAEEERAKLQEQLNQSQKMESIGRLAGGVAHDFNNMLSVVLGYTELSLGELEPSSPLYANLREVQKAAEKSADLTRQLLTFARKRTVAPKVIDLNEAVESSLKMLHRLIGEDIDLAWLPGDDPGTVRIDPAQMDQILANLCVNARNAIGGTGRVTIRTGRADFDASDSQAGIVAAVGAYALLSVSDNGSGMDRQTMAHLFEPFFTTKAMGKGTGLGLATVYGIVKQNNGIINVYSEPGQGATFKIYLPRLAEGGGRAVSEATADAVGGHGVVLVVEDEERLLDITTRMLRQLGFQALPASTPHEALRVAEECTGAIDLLLTDVVMPEMNGRDLFVRLASRCPGLRCLFMSGYSANVIAHHGVLDEGVHFIEKPFSTHELGVKIRETQNRED